MLKKSKRKRLVSFVLSLSLIFTIVPQTILYSSADNLMFEAEYATISESGVNIRNDSSASGGKVVGQFSSSDSKVTFSVNISESDYYDIIVNSKGIGSDKVNNLVVNNSNVGTFSSINNVFSEATVRNVFLQKGENSIAVTKSWGYIHLDYIRIVQHDINTSSKYEVSKELINPNATDSAKRLMSFICDNYGKNVLSGQQADNGYQSNEVIAIKNATGKSPAIIGLDLLDYSLSSVTQHNGRGKSIEKAIDVANSGGIVTMCWHWRMYDEYLLDGNDNGNPRWWGAFYTKNIDTNKFNFAKIMNDTTCKEYQLILKDIDYAAEQLKKLQDNDIPVLFRPLHEASGGWFWWGSGGSEPYKKLWKLLYDRLTNYHGLNNLIWVWNGQSASWYPGDDYCDIVGEDIYPGTHQYAPQSTKFLEASNYSNKNKVVALSENGCLFDTDQALDAGTLWSWFCTWGGSFASNGDTISTQYTELDMWKKVYQHENVITLDELPDLKNYPFEVAVTGAPEYVSTNLTLTGIIGANAYFTVPEGYVNNNYKVEAVITAKGINETRISLDKNNTKTINGQKTYVFTIPVKSCDMSKRYSVKLVVSTAGGKEVASTATSSLKLNSFAASLGSIGNAEEKAFAQAIQTYGYYSQKLFNTTETLPKVTLLDLSDVTYRTVRSYATSIKAYNGTKKGNISGASLYLDSGTGIRSYVTDLSGVDTNNLYMQYTANGVTERVKAKYSADKQAYYGEIPDIAADKLSTMYEISFCEGTTPITDTVKYGAYSYIYSTLRTSASEDTQNLVKALYKYSVAAEAMVK